MKKIAILTSGGDAPGMNAAVRAATRTAISYGYEVYGIYYGYKGLLENQIQKFNRFDVSEILAKGGTFLRSARFPEFKDESVRIEAKKILDEIGIDSLIVIGGDGSYTGALELSKLGIKVIGIPGTIDNDLHYTDHTLGFDTAVNTVVEAIDRLRDTSGSHQRCNIVEVMGRHCGDIAIHSAIAAGAKYVITPETGFDKDHFFNDLKRQSEMGIKYSIVVITEHITDSVELAKEVESVVGIESRATVLGHIQRGGTPSAYDRTIGVRFGERAVELIDQGFTNRAVGIKGAEIIDVSMDEALHGPRRSYDQIIKTFEITK